MQYKLNKYFVLPLVGINPKTINYVDSFIEYIGYRVFVVLESEDMFLRDLSTYKNTIIQDNKVIMVFIVPNQFRNDLQLFKHNRSIDMSIKAKEQICAFSGLDYNERNGKLVKPTSLLLRQLLKDHSAYEYTNAMVNKYSQYKGTVDEFYGINLIKELQEDEYIQLS
jgi:hypothetical protein